MIFTQNWRKICFLFKCDVLVLTNFFFRSDLTGILTGILTSIFDVFFQTDLTGTFDGRAVLRIFDELFLKTNWRIFDEFFGRISCRILAEFWPNFARLSLRKIWWVILTHFCQVNLNIFGRFFVDHFSRKINFTFFPCENIFPDFDRLLELSHFKIRPSCSPSIHISFRHSKWWCVWN